MRISVLVFTSILLVVLAYVVSISAQSAPYDAKIYLQTLSQVLVVMAVFTSLLAISLYEFKYKRKIQVKIATVHRSSLLKVLFTALTAFTSLIISMPLSSTMIFYAGVALEVENHLITRSISYHITFSCLAVTSLVLFIIVKGLFNSNRELAVTLLVSPILAFLVFHSLGMLALLIEESTRKAVSLTIALLSSLFASIQLGLIVTALSVIYLVAVRVFKGLASLDLE